MKVLILIAALFTANAYAHSAREIQITRCWDYTLVLKADRESCVLRHDLGAEMTVLREALNPESDQYVLVFDSNTKMVIESEMMTIDGEIPYKAQVLHLGKVDSETVCTKPK
jgi:hypothetical protein